MNANIDDVYKWFCCSGCEGVPTQPFIWFTHIEQSGLASCIICATAFLITCRWWNWGNNIQCYHGQNMMSLRLVITFEHSDSQFGFRWGCLESFELLFGRKCDIPTRTQTIFKTKQNMICRKRRALDLHECNPGLRNFYMERCLAGMPLHPGVFNWSPKKIISGEGREGLRVISWTNEERVDHISSQKSWWFLSSEFGVASIRHTMWGIQHGSSEWKFGFWWDWHREGDNKRACQLPITI